MEAQAEALRRRIVLAPPGAWQRSGPGGWSPAMVVGHICEFLPYWASRAVVLAANPGASWGREEDDPDRSAGIQFGASLDQPTACERLDRAAAAASAAIRELTPAQLAVPLQFTGGDPARNSVAGLVEHALCRHLESHHAQLRRLLASFAP
ncbi:DinB family protein [Tepidiforma sp.]|uniref:DinB family protein n=1 Tax=Tepidiforma sp. TaxID=2682230 RepID=UPI0030142060